MTGTPRVGTGVSIPVEDSPSGAGTVAAPAALTGSASAGTATLSWSASPNATSYEVFRGSSVTAERVVAAPLVSAELPLDLGASGMFRVAAKNVRGSSVPVSVTVLSVPAAPTGVSATVAGTTATIRWTPVSAVDGYYVCHDGTETVVGTAIGQSRSETTVSLVAGQEAVFVVKAYNLGGISAASAPVSAAAIPAPPANVTAAATGASVTVPWGRIPAATGYEVMDGLTIAAVVAGGSTTTEQFSILAGSTASVTVKSKNVAGTSAASTPAVSVTAAPAAPFLSGSKDAAGTGVSLSWTAPSGATSYRVLRDAPLRALLPGRLYPHQEGVQSSPSSPSYRRVFTQWPARFRSFSLAS